MFEKIKKKIQDWLPMPCECGYSAVVICKTHNDDTVYLCSNCLRSFRFREKDYFKSIKPYGNEK